MTYKKRLDQELVVRGLVATRSQAESYIRMGAVTVDKKVIIKTGFTVPDHTEIKLNIDKQYVSRAGLKLASVAKVFRLDFRGKAVLDVGSSTGGFTDFALRHGASKVIAVDVGTNQLHPSLRSNTKVELHEQTDIRDIAVLSQPVDYIVIDVSFISLREILPTVARLAGPGTTIVAMVKPQFEAGHGDLKYNHLNHKDLKPDDLKRNGLKHKGVIKNEKARRDILKSFEGWAAPRFKIQAKADSQLAGEKGNKERFYLLNKLPARHSK